MGQSDILNLLKKEKKWLSTKEIEEILNVSSVSRPLSVLLKSKEVIQRKILIENLILMKDSEHKSLHNKRVGEELTNHSPQESRSDKPNSVLSTEEKPEDVHFSKCYGYYKKDKPLKKGLKVIDGTPTAISNYLIEREKKDICANCGHLKSFHIGINNECVYGVRIGKKGIITKGCSCKKFKPQNHSPQNKTDLSRNTSKSLPLSGGAQSISSEDKPLKKDNNLQWALDELGKPLKTTDVVNETLNKKEICECGHKKENHHKVLEHCYKCDCKKFKPLTPDGVHEIRSKKKSWKCLICKEEVDDTEMCKCMRDYKKKGCMKLFNYLECKKCKGIYHYQLEDASGLCEACSGDENPSNPSQAELINEYEEHDN